MSSEIGACGAHGPNELKGRRGLRGAGAFKGLLRLLPTFTISRGPSFISIKTLLFDVFPLLRYFKYDSAKTDSRSFFSSIRSFIY